MNETFLIFVLISFPLKFVSSTFNFNFYTGLFLIGISGNFYHHNILASLRNGNSNNLKYVAPRGGLFNYVAAPHYMFELIGWFGIAVAADHMNAYLVFTTMASYLAGRAASQNEWNRSKFSEIDWPIKRKNMIPFLF